MTQHAPSAGSSRSPYAHPLLLTTCVLGGLVWALVADGAADSLGTLLAAAPLLVIVRRVVVRQVAA